MELETYFSSSYKIIFLQKGKFNIKKRQFFIDKIRKLLNLCWEKKSITKKNTHTKKKKKEYKKQLQCTV